MHQVGSNGKRIGNYRLVKEIGRGSYGSVYLAEHIYLNRTTAVKLLYGSILSTSPKQDAFLEEAKMLDRLRHRYVLPIIDVGIEDNLPYIMIEYAQGGSLHDLMLQCHPAFLPMRVSLVILSQIGQALHYAHLNKVVHRDLKPANILFNEKGEALLADFGIAILLETGTKDAVAIGTFPYMAPEQFMGKASLKADQYSLACIAYELFTGHKPIVAPRNANYMMWAEKVLKEIPVPPRRYNPDIPEYIEAAILKGLKKDRKDRYSDVSAFIAALEPQQLTDITQLATSLMADTQVSAVSGSLLPHKSIEQLLAEGNEHLKNQQLEDALDAYQQAIQIVPDKDILYNLKGKVLHELKHYEEAIHDYEEAIRISPHKAIFYVNKGDVLRATSRFEEAISVYEQASKLAPNGIARAKALAGKADALWKLSRYEEALIAYKEAIDLDNTNIALLRTSGDAFRHMKRYKEAFLIYERAKELAPDNSALLNRYNTILKVLRRQP